MACSIARRRCATRPARGRWWCARGEIRFAGVRFGYRPARPALRGLDLVIPAGLSVALVGPSGAGKSTMLNLILRFYDVDQGAVLIDDQDVRGVTLASLRGAIALVSQEVDLFDDTVRANIAYGRPDASDEAIEAAARARRRARLHLRAAARLRHRDRTERREPLGRPAPASRASPGRCSRTRRSCCSTRRPRRSTARPSAPCRCALRRLMRGRTTVVIAHRLSTVMGADLIAVIEHGRVVEQGTHRALLARGGSYARLYERQFADQDAPAAPVRAIDARLA